jgi:general secretion pathway protein D
MKHFILLALYLCTANLHAAQNNFADAKIFPIEAKVSNSSAQSTKLYAPTSKGVRFDFQSINVAQVLQLIYSEALKTAYVLDPDVLSDSRLVSFRYEDSKGDLRVFLRTFLDSLGYSLESRGDVDFVAKAKLQEKSEAEQDAFIYRPKFREVSYLARLLSPLFKGSFSVNRSIATPEGAKVQNNVPDGSAASLVDQSADTLVFSGTEKEIEKLKKLLPQVDFAIGEILVRGVVYEVTTSDNDGSAFQLALNLLGGKFTFGLGGAINASGSFLRFKNNTIDAVFSALSGDSRFKVVSSPSLRIRSGATGRFSVGQEVPVLGALSYPQGAGQAVQSVEYRSSGVIFDLHPQVRDAVVDLSISQQLSNFVNTTTGVNKSPTLIKRAVETAVSMADGDIIVLGGLTENKETGSSSGFSFLPSFLRSKQADKSRSEILLILQMSKI